MKIKSVHIFISIVIACVIAVVAAGFYLIGQPNTQRAKQADQLRVKHLQQIRSGIDAYWAAHSSLPETLEELRSEQMTFRVESIHDPSTNQLYGYYQGRLLMQYTLCAIFETEAHLRRGGELQEPYPDPFWDHPAGNHCFDLRANVPNTRADSIPKTPQIRKKWNEATMGKMMTTYTHPNGYAVRYPASWELQTNAQDNYPDEKIVNDIIIRKDPTAQVPDGYSEPCPDNVVGISIKGPFLYSQEDFGTFDKLVNVSYDKDGSLGSFSGKKEKRSINGLLAYRFEEYAVESVCSGPVYLIRFNSEEYLLAHLILNVLNKENIKIASQIAESIKRTK